MTTLVISLGGSVIVPDEVDGAFLRDFRELILSQSATTRFFIICGGGKTARRYQDGLRAAGIADSATLDHIGISASLLNARLLQQLFGDAAGGKILTDPTLRSESTKSIVLGAGWKPGQSTDAVAVQVAVTNGATTVLNLSNVAGVYDKDPKKFSDAIMQKTMSWEAYLNMVGTTWKPGMHVPFDPVAAQLATQHHLTVIVASGTHLSNLNAILTGQPLEGTVIS